MRTAVSRSLADKEKINLEIYAEGQNDAAERERCFELARGDSQSQEREAAISHSC